MEVLRSYELTPVLLKLFIASVIVLLIYDWWCHQFFQRRGIRVAPYIPVIGSRLFISGGIGYRFAEYHRKYGRVFGWYMFRNPIYAITDTDLLKEVMVKSFSHFINRRQVILGKPLDKGLISLEGDHWKRVRSVVTPAFSAVKMKQMSPMINDCCDVLLENFGKVEREGKPADCKVLYGGFTMDSVAWCGFGLKVDSQKNKDDEFVTTAQKAFVVRNRGALLLSNLIPYLKPIFNYFNVVGLSTEVTKFFSSVTEQAWKLRKDRQETDANSSSDKQIDMLQLLLNAHNETDNDVDEGAGPQLKNKGPKRALTNDEITAQAITFFLAGYETTNALLGFASYLLALNQDCQEKLYSEILDVTPSRDLVGYDMANKMPYLDMVISETLRCYPPAAGVFRTCNETFSCDSITVEKGGQVFINIYAIHHDEKYWPNPAKFDPERFSLEKKASIQTCTYMPFGFGPRSCIGMRFALLEAKMALVRVLQQYRLDVCSETQIPLIMSDWLFLSPKKGIKLRPVLRK